MYTKNLRRIARGSLWAGTVLAALPACEAGSVAFSSDTDEASQTGSTGPEASSSLSASNESEPPTGATGDDPPGSATAIPLGDESSTGAEQDTDVEPESVCGDDVLSGEEACDGSEIRGWDEGVDCEAILGAGHHGPITCTNACTLDTSACTSCGDNVVQEEFEACDGTPLGDDGHPLQCSAILGDGHVGVFGCRDDCGSLDASDCVPLCGNGALDPGESCDAALLGEQTCETLGFVGGSLACSSTCAFDLSGCRTCGNAVLDVGEPCDGAELAGATCREFFDGGTGELACATNCAFDTGACVPNFASALISEIMVVPLVAPLLNAGEWVELFNPHRTDDFSLAGCTAYGLAPFETFDFPAEAVVPANGYLTLGKGKLEELGFVPDFELPPQTTFLNAGDTLRIECAGALVDEVEYGGTSWPALEPGLAISVSPGSLSASQNDSGSAWCTSSNEYAPEFFGTPGASNRC